MWFPAPGWNQSNVYFGQIQDDNVPGDFVIPPEDGIIGFAFEGLSAWQQSCAFSYMSHVYQSISLCTSVTPAPGLAPYFSILFES